VAGARLGPRMGKSIAGDAAGASIVVVSDARVARLHAAALLRAIERGGGRPLLLTFPAGERSKSREMKARLEDRLASLSVGRDALFVALGGGVTGDLAGFLAATWHRGVPVVQVPTSLLAMVDAALGGKTGVDLPAGKNLVGAFHPPRALWADVTTLDTLPRRELSAGLAEAVKIAAVLDARLFALLDREAERLLARDASALLRVIGRCLRLKAKVVAEDLHDRGPRAILNFGHTVAHALESASGYRLRHGEAVAIGMVVEARIAERLTGFPREGTARLTALLARLGLPVTVPAGIEPRRIARLTLLDKKARGGTARCALPRRLGVPAEGPDPTRPIRVERDLLPALRAH